MSIVPRAASDANGAPDDPDPSGATLESEFMRVMREQNARVRQATATRWKQGGLRPRVVHESDSDYIRRVDFQWPNAVMGTASGAVLVSNCEELGGSEYRERARRLVAARRDAHGRRWQAADDRGLGERSLLGLYDGGAITAVAIADDVVASGGRDGYLRAWRLPKDADVDSPSHPSEGLPLELRGEAKHPNVVTSIAMDPTTGTAWTTCLDGCLRRWEYARGAAARIRSPEGAGGGPIFRLGLGFARRVFGSRGSGPRVSPRCARRSARGNAWCTWAPPVDSPSPSTPVRPAAWTIASRATPPAETRGALCRWLAHGNGAHAIRRGVSRRMRHGLQRGTDHGVEVEHHTVRGGGGERRGERGPLDDGTRPARCPSSSDTSPRWWRSPGETPRISSPARTTEPCGCGTCRNYRMRRAPRVSRRGWTSRGSSTISCARARRRMTRRTTRRREQTRPPGRTRGDGDGDSTEAKAEAEAPKIERREALYAVTGHTVWLGGISADDTRILCDGANNIALMYDYSEDPDGDGDV